MLSCWSRLFTTIYPYLLASRFLDHVIGARRQNDFENLFPRSEEVTFGMHWSANFITLHNGSKNILEKKKRILTKPNQTI